MTYVTNAKVQLWTTTYDQTAVKCNWERTTLSVCYYGYLFVHSWNFSLPDHFFGGIHRQILWWVIISFHMMTSGQRMKPNPYVIPQINRLYLLAKSNSHYCWSPVLNYFSNFWPVVILSIFCHSQDHFTNHGGGTYQKKITVINCSFFVRL